MGKFKLKLVPDVGHISVLKIVMLEVIKSNSTLSVGLTLTARGSTLVVRI